MAMRAVTCRGYGAPDDVLSVADIDEPHVTDNDVLVTVRAASVNPADWHLIRGAPYLARLQVGVRRPPLTVPGSDFSGTVAAVGDAVTTHEVGDQVFGTTFMHGFGAFAERVVAPAALVAPKPASITFDEAAAVPLAASTALQGLRDHGHIEGGHRVLVVGASGGVGSFAVQIAKALGAEVTGVCSSKNADLVTSLGADHVIDYAAPGAWEERGGYDIVLQVAGAQGASQCRRLLTPRGTLVQISGDSDNRWIGPVGRLVAGRLLSRFVSQTITSFTVRPSRDDLEVLAGLVDSGKVKPVIDATYPLDRVHDALRQVEGGHTRGKVVLQIGA
jgi:NADPH:quinone reductase-like Zn-dependent oxidoreductase